MCLACSSHVSQKNANLQILAKSPRPARPGYCNIGQSVRIKVNHFEVKCNLTQAFHYDVVLTRPRKSKSYLL